MLALLMCLTDGHVFAAELFRADVHALVWSMLILSILLPIIAQG